MFLGRIISKQNKLRNLRQLRIEIFPNQAMQAIIFVTDKYKYKYKNTAFNVRIFYREGHKLEGRGRKRKVAPAN